MALIKDLDNTSSFQKKFVDFAHSGNSIFSLWETSGTVIIKSVSSIYNEYWEGFIK